jgi:hypothetical protein
MILLHVVAAAVRHMVLILRIVTVAQGFRHYNTAWGLLDRSTARYLYKRP